MNDPSIPKALRTGWILLAISAAFFALSLHHFRKKQVL